MVQAGSALGFGAFGLAVVAERVEAGEAVVEVETPGGQAVSCDRGDPKAQAEVHWVETPGGQAVSCDRCGGRARSKGRRMVVLRDVPAAGGMPVRVWWNKRVWACPDTGCEARTWTEQSGLAGPRRVLTGRAVDYAVGALGAASAPVAGLARGLGVGRHTVWAAVRPALQQAADDPGRVVAAARVGFSETVMASATRRRRRRFVTAAVDAATGQIMDVFDGRDAADLEQWAQGQPEELMAAVEVVCLDPHEGYRKAVGRLKDRGVLGAGAGVAADPSHTTGRPQRQNRSRQPPKSKTSNAQAETSTASPTTDSESYLQPDNHPAKPNPPQKSEPDVPASSRRAPYCTNGAERSTLAWLG